MISLTRMRDIVQSTGAQLTSRYAHLMIQSAAPLSPRSGRRIAGSLRDVPGVLEADIGASGAVRVEYDRSMVSARELRGKAIAFGVRSIVSPVMPHPTPAEETKKPRSKPHSKRDERAAGDNAGHDHGEGGDHAGHQHTKGDGHADGDDHADHDHAHGGLSMLKSSSG